MKFSPSRRRRCRLPSSAPSSLEMGDLEGGSAGEVQEEGSFLFGQEGGGDDVVDACRDVVQLHVAEATSGKKGRKTFRLNRCSQEVQRERKQRR